MPGSMPEGKQFIKNFLLTKDIKRILDVGPGSGNYYDLLSKRGEYEHYDGEAITGIEWVAVEIWEPYVNYYGLEDKYSKIFISDISTIDWGILGNFDVVILGDVLEHMEKPKAAWAVRDSVEHSKWVVISLPIVYFPQDAADYENKHEAHIEHYTSVSIRNLLKDYSIPALLEGNDIGVYILRGKND